MMHSETLGLQTATQLVTTDPRFLYATDFDKQLSVPRPDVALLTTWSEVPNLGLANVQSLAISHVHGVAYVFSGLASRPLIRHLVVAGKSTRDGKTGGNVFAEFARIKSEALATDNYQAEFLNLASQSPLLQELISFLRSQGWWDKVPQILAGVEIHVYLGVNKEPEIREVIDELPILPMLLRGPEFLSLPKRTDEPPPLPMLRAPEIVELVNPDPLCLWRLGLERTLRTDHPRNGSRESNIIFGMPYMNPDEISDADLKQMGMTPADVMSKYALMIPLRELGSDELFNPGDVSYLYVVAIWGIDTFAELLEDVNANPAAMEWLDARYEGKFPRNHFKEAVDKLAKDPTDRSAVISVFDNNIHGKIISPPCLSQIHLMSDPETGRLNLQAIVRSHDMFKAWPGNMLGLMKLLEIACKKINGLRGEDTFLPGNIQIWSQSAHIYAQDREAAKSQVKRLRRADEWDRRGNFVDSFDLATGELTIVLNPPEGYNRPPEEVYKGPLHKPLHVRLAMEQIMRRSRQSGNIAHMAQVLSGFLAQYQTAQALKGTAIDDVDSVGEE